MKFLKKNPVVYNGNDYPLHELTDKAFEEFCYEILKYSSTLKKQVGYTEAFYKEGGKDKGKDGIIYLDNKEIGISQCKHSISNNNMRSNIITDEILKMLLYLLISKREIKKYIFFISSRVTDETHEMLINFTEKFLSLSTTDKKIENIIGRFSTLKNNNELISMKIIEIKEKLIKICQDIEMYFFYNVDIQSYLIECPVIIIEKYFSIKTVIEKERKYELPFIEDEEVKKFINDKKLYKNDRYKEKLLEIDVNDFYIEEATKNLIEKCLVVIKLHKSVPNDLTQNIKEYEKELLSAEKHERYCCIENLPLNYSIKNEDKKYYMNFMKELSQEKIKIQMRNFEYVTPTFAKGTIQELVNDNKIEDWLIKIEGEK